jgi:hypothetical protein
MTDHNKKKRLRVFCTEDGCMEELEPMEFPSLAETELQSRWLNIFCPQDACEITSPTQLP